MLVLLDELGVLVVLVLVPPVVGVVLLLELLLEVLLPTWGD